MSLTQEILEKAGRLPTSAQEEVLHFIEFMHSKNEEVLEDNENSVWQKFSLSSAMRGMKDEPSEYTL